MIASRSSLAPRLFAGFGLAALLGGIGLASTRPARSTGGPVPVTVTNPALAVTDAEAARQAVSASVILTGPVFSAPEGTLYTVPANKRLIIETVNGIGNRRDANSYTIELDTIQGGELRQTFFTLLPSTAPYPAFSQTLRLYADPGSQVRAFASSDGRATPFVGLSLSGHLVDL